MAAVMTEIDVRKIPPLERRLLGGTFFKAMERFYADPNNQRRFETWEREHSQATTDDAEWKDGGNA